MGGCTFSLILPVRNGGRYLRGCVESVLAQTHGDLELTILDNGGTAAEIDRIRRLKDSRIAVHAAPSHLSIEENWQRALGIPKKEFMTFIGADDLLDPDYLRVMNALIKRFPDAGLYHAHFRLIDQEGKLIRHCLPMPERETAADFLAARLMRMRDSFGTGYVMRAKMYDTVGGIPGYRKLLYADDALWLTLMLGTWKATAAEECFSYRVHSDSASGEWDPEARLAAVEQYATFLGGLRQKEPACAQVLDQYAGDFFGRLSRRVYLSSVWEASSASRATCQDARERLVIVQEAVRRGGVGAEIAAAVVGSEAFGYLQAPIVRVANPGVPVPHSAALHRFAFPHKDDVIAAVRHVVSYT